VTVRDLKGLFPQEAWNKLHLQIIFMAVSIAPLAAAMAPCAACAESSIPPSASRCNGARPEQKSLNTKNPPPEQRI
jgi:hypothetical protein